MMAQPQDNVAIVPLQDNAMSRQCTYNTMWRRDGAPARRHGVAMMHLQDNAALRQCTCKMMWHRDSAPTRRRSVMTMHLQHNAASRQCACNTTQRHDGAPTRQHTYKTTQHRDGARQRSSCTSESRTIGASFQPLKMRQIPLMLSICFCWIFVGFYNLRAFSQVV
jgi:hypothetical protein